MAQKMVKMVFKISTMTDNQTKQKAIQAAADIIEVDSIEADITNQNLTVIGRLDTVAVVNRLQKLVKDQELKLGKEQKLKLGEEQKLLSIVSVGPAKEVKKEEKKEEKPKEVKKEERKEEKPKEVKKEEKKDDKQKEKK